MLILPIFIPHQGCPFNCSYCNQNLITNSDNPDLNKVEELIQKFCLKHPNESKEIAFFGGNFTGLERSLQKDYLNLTNKYDDGFLSIRISTRPDYIDQSIIEFLKNNNIKTIELGIQSFSDVELNQSGRGYDAETASNACQMILDNDFDLGIQLLLGLPGYSEETLRHTLNQTISLKPKYVRLYPLLVLKNTELAKIFYQQQYVPLSFDKSIDLCADFCLQLESSNITVIKIGLHSDLSLDIQNVVAGPYHPAFGEFVRAEILFTCICQKFDVDKALYISPKDVSLFKGHDNYLLNKLKNKFNLPDLSFFIDKQLAKGVFYFSEIK